MTDPLVVRPRRLRYTAYAVAASLAVVFAVVGAALRGGPPGDAQFQLADQVAMTLLGVLGAGVVLVFTRFRVVADAHAVRVRNAAGEKLVPWQVVAAVRFADGDSWAHLELHDDETIPLLAVQANDGARAGEAVVVLRRLLEQSRQQ